jgi:hypothetical protein
LYPNGDAAAQGNMPLLLFQSVAVPMLGSVGSTKAVECGWSG